MACARVASAYVRVPSADVACATKKSSGYILLLGYVATTNVFCVLLLISSNYHDAVLDAVCLIAL
jgi:hypothetical protein